MITRRIFTLLALVTTSLGFIACSPDKNSGAAKELNVFLFSMPYTRALDQLEDDFEAKTGIKANINVVGQGVFENRITLSFVGKTGDIDVVHAPAIWLQKWVEAGWLQSMTAQMGGMKGRDDILSGPLNSCLVDGEYWAIPYFAGVGLMAYRKDLLAAAGFNDAPETWEDMLQVAAKIHSDETAAIAMRATPGQGFNMFVLPMITRAYGGSFFANFPDDLTPAINSPENLKGLEIYSKLLNDYGPDGAGNFNFGEVVASMQSGKVAMTVDGSAIIAQVVDLEQSQFADKMDIAPVPKGPAGRSPAIAVHGLGIPADAPNSEASFKFIEWATSTEVLTKIALMEAFPDFTRASVSDNTEVQKKYAAVHPEFLELRIQALNEAIGHYRPLLPEWSEIGAAVGENVNAALNGLLSNSDALKAADAEMVEIMKARE